MVLPILLAGLEAGPKMSMAASLALKDLARDCRQALVPHTQPVLEVTQRLLLGQQLRLPRGTGGSRGTTIAGRGSHPASICLHSAPSLPRHASDEGTIEALCECVKRAAVALERPAAEQILCLLVQLQEACPQASVVDTCRPLLLMLSIPRDRLHPAAVPALARIYFQERTAVLESFYLCLGNLARKAVYVLTPEAVNLSMVFQCAILAIGLPEKGTVKAAAFFLAEVVQQSLQHVELVQLAQVVDTYRMLILERCFLVCNAGRRGTSAVLPALKLSDMILDMVVGGGQSPRSSVEPMADVVLALTKQNLQATSRERTNKRIIKEALVEMSLVCRGLVGTEYAAQTTQHFP
ncbi:hypothetical protein MTO96_016493 [Rhipicephalus appendiculatus]